MANQVTARYTDDGPYPGAHVGEQIEVDIDTDSSGDGSLAVNYDVDFAAPPVATLGEGSDEMATVVNRTADGCTVDVSGSGTTSGTVSATLAVRGPRA